MVDYIELILHIAERWQSGRMRYLGKVVYEQSYRGFESRPLRNVGESVWGAIPRRFESCLFRRMYKAIIFDIGEVITTSDFSSAYGSFAELVGVPEESVATYYNENLSDLLTGKISTEESMLAMNITSFSKDEVLQLWNQAISTHSKVRAEMIQLLDTLRECYTVLALSNVTESRIKTDKEMGLYEHFDDVTLSFYEGLRKPDPKFFEIALSKANSTPQEAIFIDDYESLINAAKDIGIDGIHFKNYNELINELRLREIRGV